MKQGDSIIRYCKLKFIETSFSQKNKILSEENRTIQTHKIFINSKQLY